MHMKFFKGKTYDNNMLSYLSRVLYNVKWLGLLITICMAPISIEMATDGEGVSRDEEEYFYGFLVILAVTIVLFVYDKKWKNLCDKIMDKLNK